MNFSLNIRSLASVFLHHLLDVLGIFKELRTYEQDLLILLASPGRPRSQSWTGTGLHVDMFEGELILLPHFWPPAGSKRGLPGVCVCSRPVSRQPFSSVRRRPSHKVETRQRCLCEPRTAIAPWPHRAWPPRGWGHPVCWPQHPNKALYGLTISAAPPQEAPTVCPQDFIYFF